jgi:hypothetical protein
LIGGTVTGCCSQQAILRPCSTISLIATIYRWQRGRVCGG